MQSINTGTSITLIPYKNNFETKGAEELMEELNYSQTQQQKLFNNLLYNLRCSAGIVHDANIPPDLYEGLKKLVKVAGELSDHQYKATVLDAVLESLSIIKGKLEKGEYFAGNLIDVAHTLLHDCLEPRNCSIPNDIKDRINSALETLAVLNINFFNYLPAADSDFEKNLGELIKLYENIIYNPNVPAFENTRTHLRTLKNQNKIQNTEQENKQTNSLLHTHPQVETPILRPNDQTHKEISTALFEHIETERPGALRNGDVVFFEMLPERLETEPHRIIFHAYERHGRECLKMKLYYHIKLKKSGSQPEKIINVSQTLLSNIEYPRNPNDHEGIHEAKISAYTYTKNLVFLHQDALGIDLEDTTPTRLPSIEKIQALLGTNTIFFSLSNRIPAASTKRHVISGLHACKNPEHYGEMDLSKPDYLDTLIAEAASGIVKRNGIEINHAELQVYFKDKNLTTDEILNKLKDGISEGPVQMAQTISSRMQLGFRNFSNTIGCFTEKKFVDLPTYADNFLVRNIWYPLKKFFFSPSLIDMLEKKSSLEAEKKQLNRDAAYYTDHETQREIQLQKKGNDDKINLLEAQAKILIQKLEDQINSLIDDFQHLRAIKYHLLETYKQKSQTHVGLGNPPSNGDDLNDTLWNDFVSQIMSHNSLAFTQQELYVFGLLDKEKSNIQTAISKTIAMKRKLLNSVN